MLAETLSRAAVAEGVADGADAGVGSSWLDDLEHDASDAVHDAQGAVEHGVQAVQDVADGQYSQAVKQVGKAAGDASKAAKSGVKVLNEVPGASLIPGEAAVKDALKDAAHVSGDVHKAASGKSSGSSKKHL